MKFAIISSVFPPEPVVSAQTSAQVARGLAERGHAVQVITAFPNRPAGKLYAGFQRRLFSRAPDAAGLQILRCFSFFSPRSSMLSRWLENISFGVSSSLALLGMARPDAVYLNTWPIFAAGLVSLVCKLRRIPLVVSVQDMYPESLVNQGRFKPEARLYKMLLTVDRWVARQAAALIVISSSFVQGYTQARQIAPNKLQVIANWVDANTVDLLEKSRYRREAGISDEALVLMYAGNIGVAAGVETVFDALSQVQTQQELVLVIAGAGSQLAACQKKAQALSHIRCIFHTPWQNDETSKVLAAADVLLLPTRGQQSLVSVPSKLITYMLAARPILAAVLPESESARMIAEAQCGWVVAPEDIPALTQAILALTALKAEETQRLGAAGRAYALQHFSTEVCLPKIIDLLEGVAKK